MKKAVDQNGIVCIAPAGQTSIDGASPFISPQIVKLIRMCKSDVLALKMLLKLIDQQHTMQDM